MTYRGYTAVVVLDDDDKILVGRVVDLRDVIHCDWEPDPLAELDE